MNSSSRQPRSRIFDPDSQRLSDRPLTPTRSISPLQQVPQLQQTTIPSIQQFQPQKLKHVLYNAQQSTPLVTCHYHPDQVIQNFCKNSDCLLPLCPACVTIHQEDHNDQDYTPHFDLLGTCLAEQYNKIVDVCNLQAEDIENIVELKTTVKNHREVQKKKFLDAKEQFYKAIDFYMQTLENNLNAQSIKTTDLLLNEINQFHRLQYDRWEDMHRRLSKLNSDKCLRTLIKCYKQSRPEDVYSQQHSLTQNFLDKITNELDQVEINPNKLQIILNELQSYISIVKDEPQKEQPRVIQRMVRPSSQQQHPQQQHPQQTTHSPIPTRVLQGFPIMQKASPITTIERMSMPQMPQLPTGYPSGIPFQHPYAQSMMLPQQFMQPQQMPFPQYFQPQQQPQQVPSWLQQPMTMQPVQQQIPAQPKPQAKQPLVQIQTNVPQVDSPGEVIDLKSSLKQQPMGMAQKYYNKLFNDTDFSPSIDKY